MSAMGCFQKIDRFFVCLFSISSHVRLLLMKMILNWLYSQAFKFPALRPPGLYDGCYSVIFSLSVTSPTVAESPGSFRLQLISAYTAVCFSSSPSLPPLSSSSSSASSARTSQPQRARAPGTASRTWPRSCPSCLGSRRSAWSCTIRTGTPPPPTRRTRPRATSRLKCEDARGAKLSLTWIHADTHTHAHAKTQASEAHCRGRQKTANSRWKKNYT